MKFKTAFSMTAFLFLLIIFSGGQADAKEPVNAPMAALEKTTVEFPPVIAGTEVQQRFSVLNKGTAPLNIINVYSG